MPQAKIVYISPSTDSSVILQEPVMSYRQSYICSPMNYIGGKYRLLPQIIPLLPKQIHTFVDLFCGGCNVGINVPSRQTIFNDNLSYLIDLYRCFNDHSVEDIITHIERRIEEFGLTLTNEIGYKELRQLYNNQRNPLDLFVLTAYSFNHQIRFNNSHEFNNPFGKERSCYNQRMKKNLIAFLDRLHKKTVVFSSDNFDCFDYNRLSPDDFIYCDPPYLITTGSYNDGKRGFTGWNESEERKLLSILTSLDNRGIRFALSNVFMHKGKENNLLREWAVNNDYYIIHLNKNYANSNYHTIDRDKNSTDEVLVANYLPVCHQFILEFL